jgi:hypothetical protein
MANSGFSLFKIENRNDILNEFKSLNPNREPDNDDIHMTAFFMWDLLSDEEQDDYNRRARQPPHTGGARKSRKQRKQRNNRNNRNNRNKSYRSRK